MSFILPNLTPEELSTVMLIMRQDHDAEIATGTKTFLSSVVTSLETSGIGAELQEIMENPEQEGGFMTGVTILFCLAFMVGYGRGLEKSLVAGSKDLTNGGGSDMIQSM